MSLKKKILGSIFILACLGLVAGGYFWWRKARQAEPVFGELAEIPEIDLSFSPLGEARLPDIDFVSSFDFSSFGLNLPDLSAGSFVDVKTPNVDFDSSGLGSGIGFGGPGKAGEGVPPPGWEPDKATCDRFKLAPACFFVPSQYRDLCKKCKSREK